MAGIIAVAIVIVVVPLLLAILSRYLSRSRPMAFRQGDFEDLIRVDCEDCDGYGFVFLDGTIVPREVRRKAYYGPASGHIHTLASVTKPCLTCGGYGSYLTDRT
jgi:hypothetical protein